MNIGIETVIRNSDSYNYSAVDLIDDAIRKKNGFDTRFSEGLDLDIPYWELVELRERMIQKVLGVRISHI